MTKEQAIEYLKADIKHWENTSVSTDHLEMAIKALEQQPSDDCVSRQAMIDSIDSIREHHGGMLDVRLVATQMPSVTPTHGTCKDCENWDKDIKQCDNMCWCKVHKGFYSANYFCADFEKRGNENGSN